MLDDRYLGAEQLGVHRPPAIVDVVDVEAVDPDETRPTPSQSLGEPRREKWVSLEVAVGPPVRIPTGVEEHRPAAHIDSVDRVDVDGAGLAPVAAHHEGVDVGE